MSQAVRLAKGVVARQNLLLNKGHDIKIYLLFHAMLNNIILKEVMIP